MDFGLGLILSFTDNATSGINNAVNSLNMLTRTATGATSSLNSMASLSALSVVSNQMGSSFVRMGSSMVGVLTNLLGKAMNVGSTFEDFGITLNQLYGDATKANEALDKLLVYGAKTPFEVEDIKDMLVVLKSQGLDAFESMRGSVSGLNQETLSWLGDLMAFKPDIPASRWKLAFTNFLGTGAPKVLENALDMGKIEDSIGHGIGDTAQERMQSLIEFVEKNNLSGLMNEMFGTWTQVTSNMSDIWTMFIKKIADAGVFENLKGAVGGLAGAIANLDAAGHLDALAEAIAGGLNLLVAPIAFLSEKLTGLITKIGELAAKHPEFVKFGTVLLGVAGVAMVAVGIFLKVVSALSGVSLLLMTMGKSFGDIGLLFRIGINKVLGVLGPFALAVGAFILAWKTDFAGIRTFTVKAWKGVVTAFDTASMAVNGSLENMRRIIAGFDESNFFDNLTLAIMKLMILGRALVEGWNNYTLSDDTFQKAEELGLIPLIERMFDFLARFREFKAGFVEGLTEAANKVKETIATIAESLDGTIFDSLFTGIQKVFEFLTTADLSTWHEIGNVFGVIAGKALLLFSGFRIGSVVFKAFSGVIKIVSGAFKTLTTLFQPLINGIMRVVTELMYIRWGGSLSNISPITNAILKLINVFSRAKTIITTAIGAIKAAIAGIAAAIGAPVAAVAAVIIAAVLAIVAFAVTHWEEFKARVLFIWDTIKEEALNIWNALVEGLASIVETIKEKFSPVLEKFDELKKKIMSAGEAIANSPIMGALSAIGNVLTAVLAPAISSLVTIVSGALQTIWKVVVSVINTIISIIGDELSAIVSVIGGVIDVIVGLFTLDFGKIIDGVKTIFGSLLEMFMNIGGDLLNGLISGVSAVVDGVVDTIAGVFTRIVDFVKSLLGIHSPSTVFSDIGVNIIEGLVQGIQNMVGSVTSAFSGIVDAAKGAITGLASSALQWGSDIVSNIASGIRGAIGKVTEAVTGVANKIKSFLHFSVPDEGPLTDFQTWMPDFMTGLADSLNGSSSIVTQAISQFAAQITQVLTTGLLQTLQQFITMWGQSMTVFAQQTLTITDRVAQVFMQLGQVITNVFSVIMQVSERMVQVFTQMGTVLAQVSTQVTQIFIQMGTALTQIATQVNTVFAQMGTNLTQVFTQVGGVLKNTFTGVLSMTQQLVTSMGGGFKNLATGMTTSFTQTIEVFTKMVTTMTQGYTKLTTTATTAMTTLVSSTNSAMNTLVSSVTSAMTRAVSAVQSAVNTMRATMNFQWKLPDLKVPHVNVSGSFNLDPPKAPDFKVDWYGTGGVFNQPNVIGVGEQGAEAVMPLERNTEWIGLLATEIGNRINTPIMATPQPVQQQVSNTTTTGGNTSYMTTTTAGSTSTDNSTHDNHVEFQSGAIVLQVKNASAEEAERLATLIMEKIKRKQELQRMATYAT